MKKPGALGSGLAVVLRSSASRLPGPGPGKNEVGVEARVVHLGGHATAGGGLWQYRSEFSVGLRGDKRMCPVEEE